MASPCRPALTAALVPVLCCLPSCGSGRSTAVAPADPSPLPPASLQLLEPAADLRLLPLASVRLAWMATAPTGAATVQLLADRDGNLSSLGDQFELARFDATGQNLHDSMEVPLPAALPPGEFTVLGVLSESLRLPVAAAAPGRLIVGTTTGEDPPAEDPPTQAPLTLQLTQPAVDVDVARGAAVRVVCAADGPPGTADLRLLADLDGDAATAADQHELATLAIAVGGLPQEVAVPLAGLPPAPYHLLGVVTAAGGASASAVAPGRARIADVAFAVREGNATYEEGRAVAALPDRSLVVAGRFAGTTTIGAWPQVTQLSAAGDDDTFLCRYLPDGQLAWVRRAGGPSRSDWPHAIAAGTDGSFVVGGFFHGLAALDGGAITNGLLSAGEEDGFVARYADDGSLLWARKAGGILRDEMHGVAMLADGSVVAAGAFAAQGFFGAGATATSRTVRGSLLATDGFVARHTADGTLAWLEQLGGPADDAARAVAVGADGSVSVAGVFRGAATFGSGSHTVTLQSAGGADVFVARYAGDGTLLWARQGGGGADDEARGLAVLADGSCVVVGGYRGLATFADASLPISVQAAGGLDAFVARYATDGTLRSVRTVGGTAEDEARGIAATDDDGCIVAGNFQVTAAVSGGIVPTNLVGAGSRDVFLARYDLGGALVWAKAAGGSDHDQVIGVGAVADGSFAVTGVFLGTAGFGDGSRRRLLTASGWADAFVVRYNADGDL